VPKDFFTSVSIPKTTKGEIWPFSIQKHQADRAGLHYDLRLGTQGLSWAIRNWPKPGERTLAKQTVDHHPSYYSFEGPIERGYGKGHVKLIDHGETEVIKSEPNKISFIQRDRYLPKRYSLIRTAEKNWLLVNHTPSNRTRPEIPKLKTKYKQISNLKDVINDNNYALSPKYDGAANVVVLRKNKHPEIFSYRQGANGLIDHSFKLNFDKYLAKTKSNKPTVLWAETLAMHNGTPKPVSETAGALNSSLEKTRYDATRFKNYVYNIDKYNGKDVSREPYEKKINLIKTIVKDNPYLNVPELKFGVKEKANLYKAIKQKKHPETKEGLIAFNLSEPMPKKIKFDKEYNVYVTGIKTGKGKFAKSLGGLEFAHSKNGTPVGVIGGGFTEEQRALIYNNPSAFIGRQAIVKAHEKYTSNALRMPIFVQWTDTQWPS
jgi:hypothetical protein